jgi:hypothetical protein
LGGGGYFTAPPLAVAEDLGGGELGDGLDPLGDGVLGQLAGQQEPDGGLDVLDGEGRGLPVLGQLGGLAGQPLEEVVGDGVEDSHGLRGDADLRVDLLQHLEDEGAGRLVA